MSSKPSIWKNVASELFIVGIRTFLDLLKSHIESHPDFKVRTKGRDYPLSLAVRTPESFKKSGIDDAFVYLRLVDQRVEYDVGTEHFEADVVLEGEWATWKNIVSGQEDLIDSISTDKLKILKGFDKLDFGLISMIVEGLTKARMPPEAIRLVEPNETKLSCV